MTDTTDIGTLTPEQAGAKLAEMKAAHDGPPPSATPATAAEAGARLGVLTNDAEFLTRLMLGNVEAKREFENLNRLIAGGDRVGDALAGIGEPPEFEVTSGTELGVRKTREAVDALREVGLGENYIHDILTDESHMDAADVATALRAKTEMLGNKEFRERYLQGDPEARRLMATANAIIIQGVKK